MALVKVMVTIICLLYSKYVWLRSRVKSSSVHMMSKLKCKLLGEKRFDIDYRRECVVN